MKASIRSKAATPRRRPAPRGNERRLVTQHPRRRILNLAAGAAVLPAVSRMAWGQAYPTRPITMATRPLAMRLEGLGAAPWRACSGKGMYRPPNAIVNLKLRLEERLRRR